MRYHIVSGSSPYATIANDSATAMAALPELPGDEADHLLPQVSRLVVERHVYRLVGGDAQRVLHRLDREEGRARAEEAGGAERSEGERRAARHQGGHEEPYPVRLEPPQEQRYREELEHAADAVDPRVEVAAPPGPLGVVGDGRLERVEVDEVHEGGEALAHDGLQEQCAQDWKPPEEGGRLSEHVPLVGARDASRRRRRCFRRRRGRDIFRPVQRRVRPLTAPEIIRVCPHGVVP
eukprot:CAMPEP_0172564862 /NCGR_PEP_ID=MMETSP1067-20121228/105982_1 /TAXON_ID=265564 ORGANISM="Thalassiosira punctigera, Strain Tpunct2005C2" /NCGR_SAMPLE_ID=MMETSP1067 /ASSEMBLY_ACC=CAM_ASM_000444 /LENGTH=235 /DNA_ID=CAMNT_0013355635 /DNA_START=472 /DNA_END=1175 /DNA_ORIENTATION=-